jgi:adenylosuccinate lyase
LLNLYNNVSSGLVVYDKVINSHVLNELPFMATENILMEAVKAGGDRQELHERIRVHSMEAARRVKQEGLDNDLIDRICCDTVFHMEKGRIQSILQPENFIGRSPQQVDEFVNEYVNTVIDNNQDMLGVNTDINV